MIWAGVLVKVNVHLSTSKKTSPPATPPYETATDVYPASTTNYTDPGTNKLHSINLLVN